MVVSEQIIDQQGRMCYGPNDTLLPSHQIFDYVLTNKLRFGLKCPSLETNMCHGTGEVCIFRRGLNDSEGGGSPIILVGAAAGDLILNQTKREIVQSPYLQRGHEPIGLTDIYWNALSTLIKNAGEFIKVEDIYRGAYLNDKIDTIPANASNLVSGYFVFVRRLLGQQKNAKFPLIQTTRGGYRLLMPRNT
ncbi:MAG TPA: hypothetical protein VLF93_02490 [Candidatus Saccharimonadales bacterium]|nr:hypothetical protein [Candidatus Saccharimonadales bacterium]